MDYPSKAGVDPANHSVSCADAGWVLVEGNWGEFVAQQTTLGCGLRREFEALMGVEAR